MSCDHRYFTPGCPNCESELRDAREDAAPSYPDDVVAVMRDTITAQRQAIAALRDELAALKAKFSGPRCDLCGNLCVDAAKDEHGYCPDCALMGQQIALAGYHPEGT